MENVNSYSWTLDQEEFTHVRSSETTRYGLCYKGVLIVQMEYVQLAEIVNDAPCVIVPNTPDAPRKLVDYAGKEISPADYEKVCGKSPASFVTYSPVFGGFMDGGGIEYWVTNYYDANLDIIRSEEPEGWD